MFDFNSLIQFPPVEHAYNLKNDELLTSVFCLSAGPTLQCLYHLSRCIISCLQDANGHNSLLHYDLHPVIHKTLDNISKTIVKLGNCLFQSELLLKLQILHILKLLYSKTDAV